jgi:hypothetical protein
VIHTTHEDKEWRYDNNDLLKLAVHGVAWCIPGSGNTQSKKSGSTKTIIGKTCMFLPASRLLFGISR